MRFPGVRWRRVGLGPSCADYWLFWAVVQVGLGGDRARAIIVPTGPGCLRHCPGGAIHGAEVGADDRSPRMPLGRGVVRSQVFGLAAHTRSWQPLANPRWAPAPRPRPAGRDTPSTRASAADTVGLAAWAASIQFHQHGSHRLLPRHHWVIFRGCPGGAAGRSPGVGHSCIDLDGWHIQLVQTVGYCQGGSRWHQGGA